MSVLDAVARLLGETRCVRAPGEENWRARLIRLTAAAALEAGMTKQQVLDILGSPADRSFRGTDEAWQYQEIAGFGQCKYTTVWISNGKLIGVSSRRGSSVAGCGLGSQEVNWAEMPPVNENHSGMPPNTSPKADA
jgi:SmpA / OmlA family